MNVTEHSQSTPPPLHLSPDFPHASHYYPGATTSSSARFAQEYSTKPEPDQNATAGFLDRSIAYSQSKIRSATRENFVAPRQVEMASR